MRGDAVILLADDDRAIRLVATTALEKAGFTVRSAATLAGLMQALESEIIPVLVSDVVFPDGDALDVLGEIKARHPGLRIIMMSARSTLLTALKAQEGEVFAYLPKPFPLDDLVNAVGDALNSIPLGADRAQDISGPTLDPAQTDQGPLIGRSPAMQGIFRSMARLLHTDLSVMITGESGSGKEVVARALHDLGHRKGGPFIAINMAAIPHDLIESELFGHEKGAFTGADRRHEGRFAQARGGTLFLDEIGDMPPEAQTRLLRVLQDGTYTRVGGRELLRSDVRIIAATHKNLPEQIKTGQFRDDLFYRLNVVPLNLPPLRDRPEDIADLANHFLARGMSDGLPAKEFSRESLDVLNKWYWPGNVRSLKTSFFVCLFWWMILLSGRMTLKHCWSGRPCIRRNLPKIPLWPVNHRYPLPMLRCFILTGISGHMAIICRHRASIRVSWPKWKSRLSKKRFVLRQAISSKLQKFSGSIATRCARKFATWA